MGHSLGISARVLFVEDAPQSAGEARACNEMMIALWTQVWSARVEGAAGYPDAEFFAILLEKADMGNARPHLRFAIESAMAHARPSTK